MYMGGWVKGVCGWGGSYMTFEVPREMVGTGPEPLSSVLPIVVTVDKFEM